MYMTLGTHIIIFADALTFLISKVVLVVISGLIYTFVLGRRCFRSYLGVAQHSRLDRILVMIYLYLKSSKSVKDSNS